MLFDHLIGGAIRGGLLLALALVAMPALRYASSSTRRLVLVLALGGALVMPAVSAMGPAWHVDSRVSLPSVRGRVVEEPLLEGPSSAPPSAFRSPPAAASRRATAAIDLCVFGLALWALGAVIITTRLAGGLLRGAAMVRRARPARGWSLAMDRAARSLGVRAEVRESVEIEAPAVTGLLSPVILVPEAAASWSDARRHSVLLHELAHVRQRDCVAHVVAVLALAAHWVNPLAWLCVRRLREERELAADDAVIAAGARASSYAEDLLAIAGASLGAPHGALGMGERSRLVGRVAAILSLRRTRTPLGRAPTALASGLFGATVLALACATPDGARVAAASSSPASALALTSAPGPSAGSAIDPVIQAAADEELERALREWGAPAGAIVVLDPRTGEIRASAGRARGVRADVATTTAYVTGSTMKAVTLAAALDDGVVTPADTFDCGRGSVSYGGQTIRDNGAYGTLSLPQMLAVSSNVGFALVFDRLGGERLERELRALHFGVAPGSIPDRIDDHSAAGAIVALGEGATATPLQVAAAYAAIANEGAYVAPITSVRSGSPPREQVMRPETARTVLAMLDEVVNGELGTGKLAQVAGARVAGKTGTAGWDLPGGGEGRYASFVGIVPEASPRFVILVGIEQPRDGAAGGQVAAPVFSRVATRALAAHVER